MQVHAPNMSTSLQLVAHMYGKEYGLKDTTANGFTVDLPWRQPKKLNDKWGNLAHLTRCTCKPVKNKDCSCWPESDGLGYTPANKFVKDPFDFDPPPLDTDSKKDDISRTSQVHAAAVWSALWFVLNAMVTCSEQPQSLKHT